MKSIELFAGGGGLALGTANAGFHHDVVVEWDDNSVATLRKNVERKKLPHVRDWKVEHEDVSTYRFTRHTATQFVFGGPPCQPFSLGGNHRGHEDERDMFPQAVRAVREVRPKAFMFENVKGLLRQSFANYYNYILHQLTLPTVVKVGDEEWEQHDRRLQKLITSGDGPALKYNVIVQLVNAASYGVPQRRERVFVVGLRSDLGVKFSFPEETHNEAALLYAKWVSGEYWDEHKIAKTRRPKMPDSLTRRVGMLKDMLPGTLGNRWRTVRDAICDLPRIRAGETSSKVANHFFNPGARSYPGHTGSPFDEPAKALKAGDHGVPGGENTLQFEDGSVRYFSVRECARLQTFPDEWVFEGSWTESMRQLGNAVPVMLAEVMARKLADTVGVGKGDRSSTAALKFLR